ncbi:MAG TPA: hypothetical protein VFB16_14600 [Bauldia sp.]|nr:hypothetical protein [Bauldia sp.]
MFDFNDAEPLRPSEVIPDGTFAKVAMTIRPGGHDGESPIDRGLLQLSRSPGSDVVQLDCEFAILEGPYARRKFWRRFVVFGGKVDESGVSIGWKITKSSLRAIIDSAHGLDPKDEGPEAQAKRRLNGFSSLQNVVFIAKIATDEEGRSELDAAITKDRPEWAKVMAGETVPAKPGMRRKSGAAKHASAAEAPAWQQRAAAQPQSGPAWGRGAPHAGTQAKPAPAAPATPAPAPLPRAPGTGVTNGQAGATPAQPAWRQGETPPQPRPGPAWLNE